MRRESDRARLDWVDGAGAVFLERDKAAAGGSTQSESDAPAPSPRASKSLDDAGEPTPIQGDKVAAWSKEASEKSAAIPRGACLLFLRSIVPPRATVSPAPPPRQTLKAAHDSPSVPLSEARVSSPVRSRASETEGMSAPDDAAAAAVVSAGSGGLPGGGGGAAVAESREGERRLRKRSWWRGGA